MGGLSRLSLLLAVALGGCGAGPSLIKSADRCARPVTIPDGWLDDAQVERLWRADRLELLKCGDKVEALSGRTPEK